MSTTAPAAERAPHRSARRTLPLLLTAVALAALGLGVWWSTQSLVLARAVGEGRAVADMAENVGRWASQYGGVHVRQQGAQNKLPGSFLTQSVYNPAAAAASAPLSEREALERVEAYYWKNPALIQREVADVAISSGSRVPYRMTARTVLNRDNQANAQELAALETLQAQFEKQGGNPAALETWKVDGGRLLYARAVVAQPSCLRCHDTPATAPDFLKTNTQFNGGGGFGYVAGKPAGVISVSVPLGGTAGTLRASVPAAALAAFAVAAASAVGLCVLALKKPRRKAR